jgi:hypothetical protein
VYWLTIGGIPLVFTEAEMVGLSSLPGFTLLNGSLVIDDSAEVGTEQVDREKGLGVGLSLSFQLLDSTTVRTMLSKWTKATQLTATLGHSDVTMDVDDTSAFGATGTVYLGLEAITYGGKNATQFTGLGRGDALSLQVEHKVGTTGQIVTDRPRFWQGRDVTLFCTMVDPSGYACGTSITGSETKMVWRGRIEAVPERTTTGFLFHAKSIERILENDLGARYSGTVQPGAQKVIATMQGDGFSATILPYDLAGTLVGWETGIAIQPFTGLAAGTVLAVEAWRQYVIDAWAQAVTDVGAGANVGDLEFDAEGRIHIQILQDPATYKVQIFIASSSCGGERIFDGGMTSDATVQIEPVEGKLFGSKSFKAVAVNLEDADPADIPTQGVVVLSAGQDQVAAYRYNDSTTSQDTLYLVGLVLVPGQPAPTFDPFAPTGEVKAEIRFTDPSDGSTDYQENMALRCLESSGTGLRGTYDTLARGQGYGLKADWVDEASFAVLTEAPLGNIKGQVTAAEHSFASLFGTLLGLFRFAVVAGPTTASLGAIKLKVVSTHPGQGAGYTITDDDLLTHAGDPVASVARLDAPNALTVNVTAPGWTKSDAAPVLFNDLPSIEANGRKEFSTDVEGVNRTALATALASVVGGQFAYDATVQAIEIVVHPSVTAEVGDVVILTCTHPALWTWNANPGAPGYDGPALVVGKTQHLKTCAVTLKLLIDGAVSFNALSPAALVAAYDNAGAPTWIEVDIKYLPHFTAALEDAGADITVVHYQPGEAEGIGNTFDISAAADVGGACRLTVSVDGSALALSTALQSTLTLPESATATTYQARFAHADDGSKWG